MSNEYKKTLKRFEEAVRAHENIGAQHPGDRDHIQREYGAASHAIRVKLAYHAPRSEEK